MKCKYLTTDEMMALERHAFENYPITLEKMMQNAGKAIFDVVMHIISKDQSDRKPDILALTGKGNNGGDALAAALLLHQKGIKVSVVNPFRVNEFSDMAKEELKKVIDAEIPVFRSLEDLKNSDYTLVIDALFGFSLRGDPKPPADELIEQINCSMLPVLAVDVPSGLDVHEGVERTPIVEAAYTITLGMPKVGLDKHKDIVGKLFLGDLGIPQEAYRDLGYEPPEFEGRSYVVL